MAKPPRQPGTSKRQDALNKRARRLARRISSFNAGRDPQVLQKKYDAMRGSAYAFLRGTAHLFYQDLPQARLLERAPRSWLCGDLHFENFGSYKGDNRLVYFDINDFDEACLGPCTLDLLRFTVSVLIGAESLGYDATQARRMVRLFLNAYVAAIQAGKARWIERDVATGPIAALLNALRLRKRKAYLDKRTRLVNGQRRLRIDGEKLLEVSPEQRRRIVRCMRRFAQRQSDPQFFRLLDVARRVAGTGSLGVERYALLVEGKGSPNRNYLLDLKQALPSAVRAYVAGGQPDWKSQAHRVVTLQRRIQAVPVAFLATVKMNRVELVLRALQPIEDRIALSKSIPSRQAEELMEDMGRLVAWGQLRSSGRQGSANADELIIYWAKRSRVRALIALARVCAQRVQTDWRVYCAAYDGGLLEAATP